MSIKERFDLESMKELACFGDVDGLEVISNEIVDTLRWENVHEFIFRRTGQGWRAYKVVYHRGATEYQDEGPEFMTQTSDGMVEAVVVIPTEVVTVQYVEAEGIE